LSCEQSLAVVAAQARVIEEQAARIEELTARVEQLTGQVAELTRRLGQARLPADTTVPWWHGRRLHFEFS